ncbi:hypothetical protein, partial [Duncaniella muris]|uniref:hypothetical protein n=1 Tax=Duncaniella muris TaxID=2094150 RepID=UPI00272BF4D3
QSSAQGYNPLMFPPLFSCSLSPSQKPACAAIPESVREMAGPDYDPEKLANIFKALSRPFDEADEEGEEEAEDAAPAVMLNRRQRRRQERLQRREARRSAKRR